MICQPKKCNACGYEWDFTGQKAPRCPMCESRRIEDGVIDISKLTKMSNPLPNKSGASLVGFHNWLKENRSTINIYMLTKEQRVGFYKQYLVEYVKLTVGNGISHFV
ncbi:hypothetical protein A2Z67_03920 [Candidatus Woesebacteria bacterium RBG_13_36_22]|uniref:Rubredoxin-like domain-containing protein n=1 Tax=Candidatus Woesebacteria bacterium RBG_13_36_22 TaxID=1802478 RepID=A0A1F7WZC3_9BACT|nr:MAG: hypothetical protein A2Z67_03920 [Candidatus Woesebacteria bacterium RBG_13_36_22]